MDTKLNLVKEAAKLAAYGFVTLTLGKIVLTQATAAQVAFDAAFKK